MTHWAHIHMLPESFFRLQVELNHHPDLMEKLSNHPAGEWEIKLAEIAAHCNILLDAVYTPDDLGNLADHLEKKLSQMRPKVRVGNIILPTE